jgi:hypothetical protein
MRLLLTCCAFLVLSGAALGQEDPAPGTRSLWTQLGVYNHADDGDGNPFLDESLTVVEPIFLWDHQVSEDWGYSIEFDYDYVSSASIERLSKFPEQSGASADNYIGLKYSSRHRWNDAEKFSWNLGANGEYDYFSVGGGVAYESRDPETGGSDTWTLNSYFDSVDIIRFNGKGEGNDQRLSVTGNWSHSQPITPLWTGTLSALVSAQSGFLETPYNAVVLEDSSFPNNPNLDNNAQGIEFSEELPDSRLKASIKLTGRRSLGAGLAFELSGRAYSDDWGITAFSTEPRIQWQVREDLRLRLRYRYYNQPEADFYSEHFMGTVAGDLPKFYTQDSDLGAFDAHTLGVRADWLAEGLPNWSLDFNYTVRGDGLNYLATSIGYRRSF